MKRIIKIIFSLVLIFLLVVTFNSIKAKAYYNDLDRILLYDIKVTPNEDGSLDMHYHIKWKVLDSSSEGPLSWVKIGTPNYHVSDLKALSDNISKVKYYSDDGSFIRIDFKKKYYAGDIVDFEYSYTQSYMYHLYDEYCIYDYQPGWFDECKVDECNLLWYAQGVAEIEEQSLAISEEDGYYKLSSPLDYGKTIHIKLKYDKSYFASLDPEKQYTDNYITPVTIVIIIAVIVAVVGLLVFIAIYSYNHRDPYMNERGFCGGMYHYYWFGRYYPRHYYGKTVNSKGARVVNPTSSSSGGFHGGGGSCACACACACAGGGRAGCSKKDFYHTNVQTKDLMNAFEKDHK